MLECVAGERVVVVVGVGGGCGTSYMASWHELIICIENAFLSRIMHRPSYFAVGVGVL